jgi:hypothetical protein
MVQTVKEHSDRKRAICIGTDNAMLIAFCLIEIEAVIAGMYFSHHLVSETKYYTVPLNLIQTDKEPRSRAILLLGAENAIAGVT